MTAALARAVGRKRRSTPLTWLDCRAAFVSLSSCYALTRERSTLCHEPRLVSAYDSSSASRKPCGRRQSHPMLSAES